MTFSKYFLLNPSGKKKHIFIFLEKNAQKNILTELNKEES